MFPIAALLEVGNVNLSRVELIWSPITTHLSEVREREREGKGVREERGREMVGCRGKERGRGWGGKKSTGIIHNCYVCNFSTIPLPQACSIGTPSLRSFAAEALTLLIRTSLENYSEEVPVIQVTIQFHSLSFSLPNFNSHSRKSS